MDYKDAGVDRDQAQRSIQSLKEKIESAYRPEILSSLGSYASAFEIPSSYKQPVILSTTDGVGTKLLLAEKMAQPEIYRSIAQDLVAMCVNDLLAARAEPICFLDYLATGKLEPRSYREFVEGLVEACAASDCSLVGGETAEMPGFYPAGRMDMAGFAIGLCEKSELWDFSKIREGDAIVGWPSSGFHSNAYSLVRKIMEQQAWTLDSMVESQSLGEFLMKPTELYVKKCLGVVRTSDVKAAIHITGGGIFENFPRVLKAPDLGFEFQISAFETPAVMRAFCEAGKISRQESFSSFNMGMGFAVIIEEASALALLAQHPKARRLGSVVSMSEAIRLVD